MTLTRAFFAFCVATTAAALAFVLVPAMALDSPWTDKDPARWRLIAAEYDGTAYAALQLHLKPGWHTYWRFPGASGIAPEFDFGGSDNLRVGDAGFPAPHFVDDGVGGFFGYQMNTGFVFPLDFQQNQAQMVLNSVIGVCREICIPLQIKADLSLDATRLEDSPHGAAIAALLAAHPQRPSAELGVGGISFDGVSLQVVVTGKDLQNPQVMIVPGPHDIIGQPRVAAQHPAAFLIEVPAWSKLDHPLIGRTLNLVIRDGARAIEADIEITDHRLMPRVMPN